MSLKMIATLLCCASVAHAQVDPDIEIARKHYETGIEFYDAGHYEEALKEFIIMRVTHPTPAIEFNIAKCLDRLERAPEAAEAYERYLAGLPEAKDAAEVRERIGVLRARQVVQVQQASAVKAVQIPIVTTVVPPRARSIALPAILAAGSLALGITSVALLGQAHASYNHLDATCAPMCSHDSWASTQAMERAGWTLVGIAGAAAVVDVALWIRARRHR